MLHLPVYRMGQPYVAAESTPLLHHATGQPVATMSLANSGLISRDVGRMDPDVLESLSARTLIDIARKAGELFLRGSLPCGDESHRFDDYIQMLSATTGSPVTYCRANAEKIFRIFDEMETILAGLMRGAPLEVLDRGHAVHDGRMVSFYREGRVFGAVLPSNSPGVHSLWTPATCLKTPVVLKPGREEPWTPLRIMEAYIAAGAPRAAFGFYPTDHAGAAELLRVVDRAMLFGDARTTAPWKNDPRVELHGPGYSKIVLGDDCVEQWPKYIDLIVSSIAANGGRSCINASAVWTPKYAPEIANALAEKLATVTALPVDNPQAQIAAFANSAVAESIDAVVEAGLRQPGARDVTRDVRGTPRLVRLGRIAYLLPTVIHVTARGEEGADDLHALYAGHPLADREFLFPYASVVQCPTAHIPKAIGSTLVLSAITRDQDFAARLMAAGNIDRLNIGPIPTWQLSWDQPHEGNLFELLYRQRSLQIQVAA